MNKKESLAYMRKNFPKYRRDEDREFGGGVIPTSNGDVADTMDKLNTFQEERRDRKNTRDKINSDD